MVTPFKNPSPRLVISLLFFLSAGLLGIAVFLDDGGGSAKKTNPKEHPLNAHSAEAEKTVNKHLKEVSRAIEMQQLRSRVQNQFVAPRIGDSISPLGKSAQSKSINIEDQGSNLANGPVYDVSSPAAEIRNELAEQQRIEIYDQNYRQEYIRQFTENARRNGWKITVDENGVIKDATPINQSPKQRLFNGSSRLSEK